MAAADTGKGPIISAHTGRVGIVTGDHRTILTSNSETIVLKGEDRNGNANAKSTGGFLHNFNVGAVGTTWQIDFYDDNTSSSPAHKVHTWVTADGKGPFALQIPLVNGLTIVESGGTAGQATIVWS